MPAEEEIIRLTGNMMRGDTKSHVLLASEYVADGVVMYRFDGGYELLAASDPNDGLTIGKMYALWAARPIRSEVLGGVIFPTLLIDRDWRRNDEGHGQETSI